MIKYENNLIDWIIHLFTSNIKPTTEKRLGKFLLWKTAWISPSNFSPSMKWSLLFQCKCTFRKSNNWLSGNNRNEYTKFNGSNWTIIRIVINSNPVKDYSIKIELTTLSGVRHFPYFIFIQAILKSSTIAWFSIRRWLVYFNFFQVTSVTCVFRLDIYRWLVYSITRRISNTPIFRC